MTVIKTYVELFRCRYEINDKTHFLDITISAIINPESAFSNRVPMSKIRPVQHVK